MKGHLHFFLGERRLALTELERERLFIEVMTSDRKVKASREG